MSISTIHDHTLRTALTDMTGSVDIIESVFTPWDDDQRAALDLLLDGMNSLEHLDCAVFGEVA